MNLYKVTVTFEAVVAAESGDAAVSMFDSGMGEIDDPPDTIEADKIESLEELPHGWDGNCIPWGNRDKFPGVNATIRQILEKSSKPTA